MILRILSGVLLAWMLGFALFAVDLPGPADMRRTEAIVVVTGSADRVRRGLALLRAGRAKRLLVSGADRRVQPGEFAAAFGVPRSVVSCCVDLGKEAVDTKSNADEAAQWLADKHFRSVRLVTTDWHMTRAGFELTRLLPPETVVVRDAVRSEPGLTELFKEYNKYVARRIAAPLGL